MSCFCKIFSSKKKNSKLSKVKSDQDKQKSEESQTKWSNESSNADNGMEVKSSSKEDNEKEHESNTERREIKLVSDYFNRNVEAVESKLNEDLIESNKSSTYVSFEEKEYHDKDLYLYTDENENEVKSNNELNENNSYIGSEFEDNSKYDNKSVDLENETLPEVENDLNSIDSDLSVKEKLTNCESLSPVYDTIDAEQSVCQLNGCTNTFQFKRLESNALKRINLKNAKCIICLSLISDKFIISECSHIFCTNCLKEWIKYSYHCPECRDKMNLFAYSLESDKEICEESNKFYKLTKEYDKTDSLSSAYLLDAFRQNFQSLKFYNQRLNQMTAKITSLKSIMNCNRNSQFESDLRHQSDYLSNALKETIDMIIKRREGLEEIVTLINPKMHEFWQKVIKLSEKRKNCN